MNHSHREGGAILVFAAVTLVVLMGVAAIAVDLANGWSTRRQAQAAADVGAVGALQAIPRTFAAGSPVMPIADDEVAALIDSLTAVNSPGSTTSFTLSADYLEVNLDVNAEARNSFARAIGAAATTSAGAMATARIEIPDVDTLYPVGFELPETQPHQCMLVSLPSYGPPGGPPDPTPRVCESGNGARHAVLEMGRLLSPGCAISTFNDAVTNFHNGVDHLIDEFDAAAVRTEADACAYGHQLTMPNQAAYVTLASFPTLLESAITSGGGPLSGSSPAIWDYMEPAPSGLASCNANNFDASLILEEKNRNMRSCLQDWYLSGSRPRLFTLSPGGSFVNSPRFGYGVAIDSNATSPADYEGSLLVWFHSLIYNDPDFALHPDYSHYLNPPGSPPPVPVGAVTMFAIDPGMLSSGDEDALLTPYGTDELEFLVIE